jgi:hypothetical protein
MAYLKEMAAIRQAKLPELVAVGVKVEFAAKALTSAALYRVEFPFTAS